jgi:tRNA pseudouridine55 synthase
MTRPARREARPIDGILLLDKPSGCTSNRALQMAKRLFNAAKAGHTGSLDPLATGMLPICFGQATKISGMLLDASKRYRVGARLGSATDSGDAEGSIIETAPVPDFDSEALSRTLSGRIGRSLQVPPMYSALKHRGRRLYELARKGIEVARSPRPIEIFAMTLESASWPSFTFEVHCSKGTYIRSLVQDIAIELGTLGHVESLRRLAVEPFDSVQMRTFEDCEQLAARGLDALDATLLPADAAIPEIPALVLDAPEVKRVCQGQRIVRGVPAIAGRCRLYAPDDRFVGIGEIDDRGEVKPRKIFIV